MNSVCAGERLVCSKKEPCSEWQGHCSDNVECKIGLRCGKSNCRTKSNGRMKLSNCCFKAQGKSNNSKTTGYLFLYCKSYISYVIFVTIFSCA